MQLNTMCLRRSCSEERNAVSDAIAIRFQRPRSTLTVCNLSMCSNSFHKSVFPSAPLQRDRSGASCVPFHLRVHGGSADCDRCDRCDRHPQLGHRAQHVQHNRQHWFSLFQLPSVVCDLFAERWPSSSGRANVSLDGAFASAQGRRVDGRGWVLCFRAVGAMKEGTGGAAAVGSGCERGDFWTPSRARCERDRVLVNVETTTLLLWRVSYVCVRS